MCRESVFSLFSNTDLVVPLMVRVGSVLMAEAHNMDVKLWVRALSLCIIWVRWSSFGSVCSSCDVGWVRWW